MTFTIRDPDDLNVSRPRRDPALPARPDRFSDRGPEHPCPDCGLFMCECTTIYDANGWRT